MRQRCVIIENLTCCPPIFHPGCPGHCSPRQLNAPRKWDKMVINAKSLCLLSCSEKGQCHCPLVWSKRVKKKRKAKDGDKDRTKACCCSGFNHQPQFLFVCVWKLVYSYCKSSPLSVFCSPVPMFTVFIPWASNIQMGAKGREMQGKNNQPIRVARVCVRQGCNTPQPSTSTFCVLILLSCSCCCKCWNSKDRWGPRWNIHSVRLESIGEMMLVVQYDLPKLQDPCVLCSVVSVFVWVGRGWGSAVCFSLALREKRQNTPIL